MHQKRYFSHIYYSIIYSWKRLFRTSSMGATVPVIYGPSADNQIKQIKKTFLFGWFCIFI